MGISFFGRRRILRNGAGGVKRRCWVFGDSEVSMRAVGGLAPGCAEEKSLTQRERRKQNPPIRSLLLLPSWVPHRFSALCCLCSLGVRRFSPRVA
jgi:hypothetical protein